MANSILNNQQPFKYSYQNLFLFVDKTLYQVTYCFLYSDSYYITKKEQIFCIILFFKLSLHHIWTPNDTLIVNLFNSNEFKAFLHSNKIIDLVIYIIKKRFNIYIREKSPKHFVVWNEQVCVLFYTFCKGRQSFFS